MNSKGEIAKKLDTMRKEKEPNTIQKSGFSIKCLECGNEMIILQMGTLIAYNGEITVTSDDHKTEYICDVCDNVVKEDQ